MEPRGVEVGTHTERDSWVLWRVLSEVFANIKYVRPTRFSEVKKWLPKLVNRIVKKPEITHWVIMPYRRRPSNTAD